GVRRAGQEEVDSTLTQPRECPQVGDATVERKLVPLEVTGVKHETGAGLDGDGQGIRNGVIDGDELEVEGSELLALALLHREDEGRDAVLFELRLDEGKREVRADKRDVAAQLQQVGHRA